MSNYFAILNGTPIYAISKKDYIDGMLKKELDSAAYYMVVDADNMMFADGVLYGKVVNNGRGVKKMPAKDWRDVLGYKESKPKVETLITERPTVEAIAAIGSERLKAVLDEAPVAKASAGAKLNELVAEGNKTVEKVIAEGETIRNATDLLAKRKRTSPSPRKKTNV